MIKTPAGGLRADVSAEGNRAKIGLLTAGLLTAADVADTPGRTITRNENMDFRIATLVLFIAMATSAGAADLETGLTAHYQGDHATALAELRPLAEEGNAEAQHVLGLMYLLGNGVAEDGYQASIWFLKAAEQGHAYAQLHLAQIYDNGLGVPPHDADAVAWYRKAAEQGVAEAQLRMGQLYGGTKGSALGQGRKSSLVSQGGGAGECNCPMVHGECL